MIEERHIVQGNSNTLSPYWLIVFLALFVAAWCFESYLNSSLSGWHSLSKRFRAQSEFLGQSTSAGIFFNVCLRYWADYSGIIRITSEEDALHLSAVFPFRPFHPPLRIPWTEIKFGRTKYLWRQYVVLTLGNQEHIPMRISERMAGKLGILGRLPA
jgi:hypothetical protein